MRRKIFSVLVLLAVSLSAISCKPQQPVSTTSPATEVPPAATSPAPEVTPTKAPVKIFFEVGEAIDAYWQGAIDGVQKAQKDFGFTLDISEANSDPSRQKEDISFAASSGKYDLIITGALVMEDSVKAAAAAYPNQKFIFFDENVSGISNIVSTTYDQYQGSFLAGALAGLITTSTNMPLANSQKVVGFVGGIEDPTVDQFRDGFIAGAKYIDPEITLVSGFLGSWNDPAQGKEMAAAQIQQGADIIFSVAGGGDQGVFEEVVAKNIYGIAVDTNLNPDFPGHVVTSMIKQTGDSLYQLISQYYQGTLQFGQNVDFGLKNKGVGLAKDSYYDSIVNSDIKARITQIEQDIADGKIITQP